jgi:hypothetical protein
MRPRGKLLNPWSARITECDQRAALRPGRREAEQQGIGMVLLADEDEQRRSNRDPRPRPGSTPSTASRRGFPWGCNCSPNGGRRRPWRPAASVPATSVPPASGASRVRRRGASQRGTTVVGDSCRGTKSGSSVRCLTASRRQFGDRADRIAHPRVPSPINLILSEVEGRTPPMQSSRGSARRSANTEAPRADLTVGIRL